MLPTKFWFILAKQFQRRFLEIDQFKTTPAPHICPTYFHNQNITVWGETTNLNLEKLCKLHKCAARIILNAKYDIPSLQLFKKLGWLSIQNRLEYHTRGSHEPV